MAQTALDIALRLIRLGRAPIPIPFKQKGPVVPNWQHLRITAETAREYFDGQPQNVGVVLGEPSGWLVDIDLDCPEALRAAPHLLPPTGTFGRRSTPASHFLYEAPGAKTRKFQFHRETLVEMRSTGCQTVFPGSTHPSGEVVEYHDRRRVTRLQAGPLEQAVARVAAAALLGRYWGNGTRHDTALALTGALLHSGWTGEDTRAFLTAVVTAGGDTEAQDRLRAVADTCERFARGEAVTGWPSLSKILPAEVLTKARDWLGVTDTPEFLIGGERWHGDERRRREGDSEARHEWPDPQPLRRELEPAEPFPIEALGEVLGNMAAELVAVVQCPAALAGQSVLAAATLAVQAHADIEIDTRVHPVSNNFITVGETGERKTAADREALAPHQFVQRNRLEQYREEFAEFEAAQAAHKKAKELALAAKEHGTAEAKTRAILALGPDPVPPPTPIMITEEPTYEGLVKALHTGWPSMGIFSDEGGRFIGGHALRETEQLKTAAGLSKLWDGAPVTRTRGGEGNLVLYGRRLAMHLMVQPAVSTLVFSNAMLLGQGLLSRCLVTYPASTMGSRPYRETALRDSGAFKRYFARLLALLEAPPPLRPGKQNELEPRRLALAPEAKREWIRFHDYVEALCAEGRELRSVRGLAAKAAEHALRLAGVLALVEDLQTGTVLLRQLQAAIELTQHYLGEALRLFEAAADDPDLRLAERVLDWMRSRIGDRSHGSTVRLRHLYQYGPNAVRDKASALKVLAVLADHGWVRPVENNIWEVRP